jgi:K+-sensing histidine kinase KdpD
MNLTDQNQSELSVIEVSFEKIKTRLTVIFLSIGIVTNLFYLVIHSYVGLSTPWQVFLFLVVSLSAGCVLLLVRLIPQYLVAHYVMLCTWFGMSLSIFYSGGVYSIGLSWLAVLPALAHFILNYKNCVAWFILIILTIAGLYYFQAYVPPAKPSVDPWRGIVTAGGIAITFFFFVLIFSTSRNKLIDLLKNKIEDIRSINQSLEKHWDILLETSKGIEATTKSFDEAINEIAKTTAKSLRISRVSIWCYSKEKNQIEAVTIYHSKDDSFSKGEIIKREMNPSYFNAISKEKIIAVTDIYTHPNTIGFAENYSRPRNIYSLMDAPFFLDTELIGVLCCEQQGQKRNWSHEDIIFATSMAEFITLAYRAALRKEHEKKISELNEEVTTQNEELRQNNLEIERINLTLEDRVKKRTEELTEQNRQLAEYAFINSHLLRAPLARVMGLTDLIQKGNSKLSSIELSELTKHLQDSSIELDGVVRKINEAIEKGTHFNREDLKS